MAMHYFVNMSNFSAVFMNKILCKSIDYLKRWKWKKIVDVDTVAVKHFISNLQ